jgi:inhibitor of KinA
LVKIVESIGTEMSDDVKQLRIVPISEHTVCILGPEVISVELHQFLLTICERLREADFPEVDQVVPAYHTITITLVKSEAIQFAEKLTDWLRSNPNLLPAPRSPLSPLPTSHSLVPTTYLIPVQYGGEFGPDLEVFAKAKGMSSREVIEMHTSVEYYVYMIGFTAGFPYLGGLPNELHHPRRDEPRLRVPAGSVGIGGAQTGVYPHEAPGGWHLIGRTDMTLFDIDRSPPAVLKPGDRVRFTEVTL